MMEEYEKSLNHIKENLDKAKSLKIRTETRLEQLSRQKQEILAEMESLGIKPEELDKEIQSLKTQIEELIKAAEDLLPVHLIKGESQS